MHSHLNRLPDLTGCQNCVGFNLRKATRAVSQFYDNLLRPLGIKGTQYSLLVVLQMAKEATVTQLAERIVMDRTTLTRNLEVMEKQGLILVSPGDDRRIRMVTITEHGLSVLHRAYPIWLEAQTKIEQTMKNQSIDQLLKGLNELVAIAHKQ